MRHPMRAMGVTCGEVVARRGYAVERAGGGIPGRGDSSCDSGSRWEREVAREENPLKTMRPPWAERPASATPLRLAALAALGIGFARANAGSASTASRGVTYLCAGHYKRLQVG